MPRRATKLILPDERLQGIREWASTNSDDFIQHKYIPKGKTTPEGYFKVPREKDGVILDFDFRWAQQRAYDIYKEELKSGKPVRLWFLKSRRVGLTSVFAADDLVDAWSRDNRRVGIVAHNDDRAKRILAMCKFFYRRLPQKLHLPLSKDATAGLKFAEPYDSELVIGTCTEPEKIRGDGLHRVHLSEAAYYGKYFSLVMQETATTIAPEAGTVAIIETTGKARGSAAHQHWLAARAGENQYRAVFLPWLEDPTCVRQFDHLRSKKIILDEIHAVEPRLSEKNRFYNLTPEQCYWAYWEFIYRCEMNFEYFCREFPYDENEAWTSSGTSFFGDNEVNSFTPDPEYNIYSFEGRFINSIFKSFDELERVEKVQEDNGALHIKLWRKPQPGKAYVIGADCSMGEAGGTFTAGYVIDMETREMMASYHGRIRPDEHAYVLASLGTIYNTAVLAPEVNPGGGGYSLPVDLQRLGYFNVYIWRYRDSTKGLEYTNRVGWWTTHNTRNLALGELRKMVQDACKNRFADPGMFKDKALINEMRSFHVDPDSGRAEASEDAWDDRIMALAIAHRVAADEVLGGALDIYASYGKVDDAVTQMIDTVNRLEEDRATEDATDLIRSLTSTDFDLVDGEIDWHR